MTTFIERVVEWLVRAYPGRFRRRFGSEVMASVRQELTAAADDGWRSLAGAAARELGQAAAGIVPEHRAARSARHRYPLHQRIGISLHSLADDVRVAVRSLVRAPTFTLVALVILSLGIGATTAIFSVVDAVVLRGLPFDEHDRLMAVLEHDPTNDTTFGGGHTTRQTFLDWRRLQQPFSAIAIESYAALDLKNAAGEPVDEEGLRVSHEFFDVLRVPAMLGRTFAEVDEVPGQHRVVVLSHAFWQRWFGGEPEAVGRTIGIDDVPWEVIGVLPPEFSYPVGSDEPAQLFVPQVFTAADASRDSGRNFNYLTIGRLAAGVSIERASTEMATLTASLDDAYPDWFRGRRARVIALHDRVVGSVRTWMLMLLGAVVFVLLIACANVANLMLARSATRAHELGIRSALGAGRGRLARGLLVESLVLAGAGTLVGVVIATLGVETLRAWLPPGIPRVADIAVDWRVLGAAALAATVTGLVFGLVPAIQGSRSNPSGTLRAGGRWSTASRPQQRFRSGLVVAEVALATVLLVGAGLFLGSFVKLIQVDPGFDYENLLTLDVGVPYDPDDPEGAFARGRAYTLEMLDAVRSAPGVIAAEAVNGGVPLTGSWSRSTVTFPDREDELPSDLDVRWVSPGYLDLLRLPLLAGRGLTTADVDGAAAAIVINEMAADRYWPSDDPLGRRIIVEGAERTVVGVVGNIRHLGPERPLRQEAYLPLAQSQTLGAELVLKTLGDPNAVLPAVKAAIWRINPNQRLRETTVTLAGHMSRLIARRRFNMALLSLFGGLGLVIAIAGIYGVIAYLVTQRTAEFGIRLALGATAHGVVWMVIRRAMTLVAAGLLLGALAAWSLSGTVRGFLFQIEPSDPRVFACALLVLAAAGLLASAIPARRAAGVNPVDVLRGL